MLGGGGGGVTFGRKLAGGGGHQLHLWGTIGGGATKLEVHGEVSEALPIQKEGGGGGRTSFSHAEGGAKRVSTQGRWAQTNSDPRFLHFVAPIL